nr:MAG TPA: hypothetical protein [Caudoviricetes sp.]
MKMYLEFLKFQKRDVQAHGRQTNKRNGPLA